MKGIILAGGKATRLFPITTAVCKQMLPVYDKPMIYYPLSVLMLAGIKDILIISTPKDTPRFKDLIGNGSQFGINVSFAIQKEPRGISESFIIGEDFIGSDCVSLILGDNIFYGHGLRGLLEDCYKKLEKKRGAIIFGYWVNNPQRYAVLMSNKNGKVVDIIEKPKIPKSNYAVVGLYFYDNDVVEIAKQLEPSKRNELEITDINRIYLRKNKLSVELMGRGYAWLDTGTHESLLEASNFVATIEHRQGLKVACLEEVAYLKGFIDKKKIKELANNLKMNQYGQYLMELTKRERIE